MKISVSILAICFVLMSCDKGVKLSDGDYLIFGHFYGECGGETCVEIFRVENNRLLEDSKDLYPSRDTYYEGSYYELDRAKFEQVKDIIDFFPKDLLNENDRVIGQPDAGDWGGLYIEYNYNGKQVFWLIDQKKNNVPAYLNDFIDKVNEKIDIINN